MTDRMTDLERAVRKHGGINWDEDDGWTLTPTEERLINSALGRISRNNVVEWVHNTNFRGHGTGQTDLMRLWYDCERVLWYHEYLWCESRLHLFTERLREHPYKYAELCPMVEEWARRFASASNQGDVENWAPIQRLSYAKIQRDRKNWQKEQERIADCRRYHNGQPARDMRLAA